MTSSWLTRWRCRKLKDRSSSTLPFRERSQSKERIRRSDLRRGRRIAAPAVRSCIAAIAAFSALVFSRAPALGLSPFYEYAVIAHEGMHTGEGEYLAGIKPEVSVNEDGWVAFIATMDPGSNLFAGQAPYDAVNISMSKGSQQFTFPQINNHGVIVTRELLSGNSVVRTWRLSNPGDFTLLASTTLSAFSQLTLPTIGNMLFPNSDPIVGFLGREGDLPFAYYANDTGYRDMQDKVSGLSGTVLTSFRSMAAATEKRTFVAQYSTKSDNGRIVVFSDPGDEGLWESTLIATTVGSDWLNLGNTPGISDNGRVVAFVGEHRVAGPGIYIAVAVGAFRAGFQLRRVFGINDIIAYDENGDPITFASFEFVNRVGVLHQERGSPGLKDDCILLVFSATPIRASRDNPAAPGRPLLFSEKRGIWSLRVDIEEELRNPPVLQYHATTPVPVLQEGDVIDGGTVEGLTLYDPLSLPAVGSDGAPHVPQPGDHYVAFSALTDQGVKVVRGARLDTDGDGLMDHWETTGIDMDGDQRPELKLHLFGANPLRKDLFVEIDWIVPRQAGGYKPWTNEFAPFTPQWVAAMFAEAPVENPDGSTGITLHIDAGPGGAYEVEPTRNRYGFAVVSFARDSVNMGEDKTLLAGGDEIGMPGDPDAHVDVVHYGLPGSFKVPGLNIRSLHEIKEEYFGNKDKWARELAFKYAVLADYHDFILNPTSGEPFVGNVASATWNSVTSTANLPGGGMGAKAGHIIGITSGEGAGQVRTIDGFTGSKQTWVRRPWKTKPDATSKFVLIGGWGGMAETVFLPKYDYHSRPANDVVISLGGYGVNNGGWLANHKIFWHVLAHELGHTLGLRHGGIDHQNEKVNYRSLMNYRYGHVVDSYAGPGDLVFNDWAYIKFDFQNTGYILGNSFIKHPWRFQEPEDTPDPNVIDYEELVGHPVDLTSPTVVITSPPDGGTVDPGANLTVTVHAEDDMGMGLVSVHFDVNGDGILVGQEENKSAADVGGGNYSAQFQNVGGPFGVREIVSFAADLSGNRGIAVSRVTAGSGAGGGVTLHESSGTIPAQLATGQRQKVEAPPIQVPGSGNLTFTVTSTPPVRQPTQDLERYDATVHYVQFKGKSIDLMPACNPPGSDPGICTSSWQAPSGGPLNVEILGPAVFDGDGEFLGHPAQDYTLKVYFEAVDVTPPEIEITSPSTGGFVGITETLVVEVNVTDDYGVASVEIAFDINDDGSQDGAGETISADDLGGGTYRGTFPNVAGDAGIRPIRVVATDFSGHSTRETGFVEVRIPDTEPPFVAIKSPPAGWPIEQNDTLTVEVNAYDDIELASVTVMFDIDGDGATTGAGESVLAEKTGVNLYQAEFPNVTGPNGSRTVNAVAADTSLNSSPAAVPVTVGGVEPTTETIFTDTGHIDAQPSVWSGGSQQVIEYDPIGIPGSGTLTFTVTATPPVRQEVQNITRRDPYVKRINFNGTDYNLTSSCNDFGADPSVCSTTFEATESGTLDFEILGPGAWNIWGEFSGHHAQDYTIEIQFTSVDITRPEVIFTLPDMGGEVDLGSPLTVELSVVDEVEVASVVVSFDVDGDGDSNDFGEQLAADRIAGDNYQAIFADLSGIPGTRTIGVLATDTSFNSTRTSMTVGVDGVGAGETVLSSLSGAIPAQQSVWNGGQRQIIEFDPIAVPGMGRITFVVTATPNVRQEVQNIERHDPKVVKINFDGQDISLTPVCNPPGSDPAVCISVWDSPGSGTLDFEILGPATYNIWGEFQGHPEQDYTLEILFLPGPTVAEVTPNTGSVGGHETVMVKGTGFGFNAVVLLGDVPATDVVRISDEELSCTTPPGVPGSVTATVLNADPEGLPWNYGGPYGLFGELQNGFTYEAAPPPQPLQAEHLLATHKGYFPAVGSEEAQQQETLDFDIPAVGRLRFEAWAFVPILNPIAGPFDDPDSLEWHNESTAVRSFKAGDGSGHWTEVEYTDLSYAYGPVIGNSTRVIGSEAAGSGQFTVKGPARWNAFWRQFGDYVMVSAPAQNWSLAVWFAEPPSLTSVFPASGTEAGGDTVTLTGSNFAEGIQILFGGALATNVVVSNENSLTCTTPPGPAGTVSVGVELLDMTAGLNDAFTYEADAQRKAITEFTFSADGSFIVGVQTQVGRTYQFQRNDDLMNLYGWADVGGEFAGTGAEESFTDTTLPLHSLSTFYRFIIRE